MDFNSLEFLVFVAAFFLLWPVVRRNNTARWSYLTVASLVFYSWGYLEYVWLLLVTGFVDFIAAIAMDKYPKHKRSLLWVSLASNLGVLGLFKYVDFLIFNVNEVLSWTGASGEPFPYLRLGLPLGISFYTFESMSYAVDVYRGRFKPTRNILKFYAFLALFPRLAAGPIVRAASFVPQLDQYNPISPLKWWGGARLIVYGLFKKAVIADQVAQLVDQAYNAPHVTGNMTFWWFVLLCFGAQVYCDFSGYSDIGRGIGKWMGLEFPQNFNHPYFSESATRYWQRWHMSLMAWLRDYVYYPVAGKDLRNKTRGNIAMTVTLLASGLWHGAAWTFLIWAAWWVAIMWYERLTGFQEKLINRGELGRFAAMVIAVVMITPSGVFFRASSVSQGFEILGRMYSFDVWNPLQLAKAHAFEAACVLFVYGRNFWFHLKIPQGFERFRRKMRLYTEPAELAILLTAAVFLRGPGHGFVYFAF